MSSYGSGGNITVTGLLPLAVASIFNTAIGANTNFLSTDITPTNTPCLLRILICLDTAGVFSVKRTKSAVTTTEQFNSGTALTANAEYLFDILVDTDETINFQTTVAAQILKFSVHEKDADM